MSELIPEVLMVNIWIRLPIRSAVRFRCVSKSWRDSLSDPDLISKNLTFSDPHHKDDDDLLVFIHSSEFRVVSYETLQVSSPPSAGTRLSGYEIVLSSCDGLVCFSDPRLDVVLVWNPATYETKTAPPLPHVDGNFVDLDAVGFGFDAKNKDYKIVKILSVWNHSDLKMEVFVHNLRSGCWRRLDEPNVPATGFYPRRESCFPSRQAYKDGTFYWFADSSSIVSFDMGDEVFKSIHIPTAPSLYVDSLFWFNKDGGSLGISTYKKEEFRCQRSAFQIWALLDAGVAQSWTPLLTIDGSWVAGLHRCLGFWRNEFLFRTWTHQLVMWDPFKRETKAINIDERFPFDGCVIHYRASRNPLPLSA